MIVTENTTQKGSAEPPITSTRRPNSVREFLNYDVSLPVDN